MKKLLLFLFLFSALAIACDDAEETDPTTDQVEDQIADTTEDQSPEDGTDQSPEDIPSDTTPTWSPISAEEGIATDITLDIYSDGWGTLLETQTLDSEGEVTFDIEEETPYNDPATYYIYARAEGFYTEIFYATKGQPVTIDLDKVPEAPAAITGVLFATQGFFADHAWGPSSVSLVSSDGAVDITLNTDDEGRYGLQNLPQGQYTLSFTYQEMDFSTTLTNGADTDYKDYSFAEPMQAAAPNLYLYPTEETRVQVELGFPQGGEVIESLPEYGDGWDVSITPDGLIDGAYTYLFYEASLPQTFQTSSGWVIDGADLEGGLRDLLDLNGFKGAEVDDFIEFWVPRLEGADWYGVYPQEADELVTLEISPAPAQLVRILWVIRPLPRAMELEAPTLPDFQREGYFGVEWGVLINL